MSRHRIERFPTEANGGRKLSLLLQLARMLSEHACVSGDHLLTHLQDDVRWRRGAEGTEINIERAVLREDGRANQIEREIFPKTFLFRQDVKEFESIAAE